MDSSSGRMKSSLIRVGMPDSALMLIQKPSVSISAPLLPSKRTRMFAHLVEKPEHQRVIVNSSGQIAGRTTSTTVRRTIQSGWVSMAPAASMLSLPMSCR